MPSRSAATSSRRRVLMGTLALTLALGLAGCGGEEKEKPPVAKGSPTADSQPDGGGTAPARRWPLTGERVRGRTPKRPVLVVKIDNSPDAKPQRGLGRADLVAEALVEGGITRLAAFYYRSLPPAVGPVRSMRATDIGLVKPTSATMVSSGAAPPTIARLRRAGIRFTEIGADPSQLRGKDFFRDTARVIPHNLFVQLGPFVTVRKPRGTVPASYLPWGPDRAFTGTVPARSVDVRFSRERTTSWGLEGGRWTNTNGYAAPGDRFRPENLLVLRVPEGDAGYRDPAGNRVPESVLLGSGNAFLFRSGRLQRAHWSKKSPAAALRLSSGGRAMAVPAGRTWIELAPVAGQGGQVTWRR